MSKKLMGIVKTLLIVAIIIMDTALPGLHLRIFILVPLYISVLSIRNNHIWYFIFEIIIAIITAGIALVGNYQLSHYMFISVIVIMLIYIIAVTILNSRGYPFLKIKE